MLFRIRDLLADTLVVWCTKFGRMPFFQKGAKGLEHTRLSFRHNGFDRRLTDVHGHVIKEILS